jgi:hypothetical protein
MKYISVWYLQNIIFVNRLFKMFGQTLLAFTLKKNLKLWDGGSRHVISYISTYI